MRSGFYQKTYTRQEREMGSLNQSGFWNGNFPHTNIFPLVAATGALLAWDLLSNR